MASPHECGYYFKLICSFDSRKIFRSHHVYREEITPKYRKEKVHIPSTEDFYKSSDFSDLKHCFGLDERPKQQKLVKDFFEVHLRWAVKCILEVVEKPELELDRLSPVL